MARIQVRDLPWNPYAYSDLQKSMEAIQRKLARSKSYCSLSKIPVGIARKLSDACPFPSFFEYMTRCLYDPDFGYYTAGHVEFGSKHHFFTYSGEMSPVFGWMLAEAFLSLLQALLGKKVIPDKAPLTILELGGGEGILARDVVEYISNHSRDVRWENIANRIQYVIIEKSSYLCELQEKNLKDYTRSGCVKIIHGDACRLEWEGCFYGIVFANEFIDAFPCERIKIHGTEYNVSRIHSIPYLKERASDDGTQFPSDLNFLADKGSSPISSVGLWSYIANSRLPLDTTTKMDFAELEVHISLGWLDKEMKSHYPPDSLISYLKAISPLISDLEDNGLLPTELNWSPLLLKFMNNLSCLIQGVERCGMALFIDYGGTSRHVIDPCSLGPHLRTYGVDEPVVDEAMLYNRPGYQDITWDIDFSEMARLAEDVGLETIFFGHQAAVEMSSMNLLNNICLKELLRTVQRNRKLNPDLARLAALALVARFREAPNFRMILFCSPELNGIGHFFGSNDPLKTEELYTISPNMNKADFKQWLSRKGLSRELADFLKPCGDPIADLSDLRLYRFRKPVMNWLRKKGYLLPPKTVSDT